MARLFGRLNNLSYRGGETETANVVIDGGVIKVDVVGSPQDVTGAYIIDNKVYITRANASPLEMALPLSQPDLAETNTESLAFVKNKKISYLENDTGYITAKDADKTYIKKVTVNGTDVPILSDGQVAQILIGEGLSVGANATISVDTSKIATNEYVDSNTAIVTENITQHKNDYNNPHKVTKAQVGLGNVDNTSDMDKPVSTLQRQALDTKVDKVEGKGLSTNDYDDTAVAEVAKIKDKADTATVTALAEQVATKTNVTVNGEHVDEFDADTKLDKIDTLKQAVYVYDANGVNKTVKYTGTEYADYTFVLRSSSGRVLVGTPSAEHDATTKLYVDNADNTKLDKAGGSITGNLAVQGDLTVSGTTTTEHQKQLLVEDNVIVTNANKVDLQSLLSGIAINKNPDATYGIMYDPSDDTVKFGQGALDENNKFVFNTAEGLPIAIRAQASDFTDAHLVKWDATKNAFVDAGYTGEDIASKTNVMVNGEHVDTFNADTKLDKVSGQNYKLYGTDSAGNQTLLQWAYESPLKETIVRRNTVGNIVIATPTADNHAATKKYVDDSISSATSITILEASDA